MSDSSGTTSEQLRGELLVLVVDSRRLKDGILSASNTSAHQANLCNDLMGKLVSRLLPIPVILLSDCLISRRSR